MDPLVSIIVPVYNVKPYLNRCVNSLLGQSYQNMELLLVDDGSTDGSETLCDEYAAQDARVRVLHKKNGGLSDARNAGVDAAAGEYLSFVDGDDWVSPYYIENLYRALEQAGADFSVSCFEEVFEGQPVQSVPTERLEAFEILSREECLRRILYQEGMEVTTPTKLYKRALFEGVRYPVNIRTGSGMTLTGTANSATGTTLTSVQVAILDAADQTVQSAAAQANAAAFSLNTLDSQIRFGELPEGSYSYMVLVTDSTGESLCFASDFTVSGSASSTQTYWSVKDAGGTKLQQTVQQMETTVETAAETTVSWFAQLFG